MFRFGSPSDFLIIALVLLVIFAPKRLPSVGQKLGEAMRFARSRGGVALPLFLAVLVFVLWLNLFSLLRLSLGGDH